MNLPWFSRYKYTSISIIRNNADKNTFILFFFVIFIHIYIYYCQCWKLFWVFDPWLGSISLTIKKTSLIFSKELFYENKRMNSKAIKSHVRERIHKLMSKSAECIATAATVKVRRRKGKWWEGTNQTHLSLYL